LLALGSLCGADRSEDNIILNERAEECLKHLIYTTAANSSKLTPSVSTFSFTNNILFLLLFSSDNILERNSFQPNLAKILSNCDGSYFFFFFCCLVLSFGSSNISHKNYVESKENKTANLLLIFQGLLLSILKQEPEVRFAVSLP
jgi:hypothetical protein